jgi:hypothetical protein
MKKLLNVLIVSIVIISGVIGVYADYGKDHIIKGEFSQGASNLKYWYDSSVTNYGLKSHFEHAIANWDSLSSQVNLTEQTSSEADIKIYVGLNNLPDNVIGYVDYWNRSWLGTTEVEWNQIYNYGVNFNLARIRMDNDDVTLFGGTWGKNIKLVGHEVGHTLSILHFDYAPSHSDTTSWMYTVIPVPDSQYPSQDDKDHLVYKWGN